VKRLAVTTIQEINEETATIYSLEGTLIVACSAASTARGGSARIPIWASASRASPTASGTGRSAGFCAVEEVDTTLGGALAVMGEQIGLYRAPARAGALTPGELASRTGTAGRYVRERLNPRRRRPEPLMANKGLTTRREGGSR
jgi:hypothetical protein